MRNKAQSQIISTVLIILLVLAAIVIVWQVVQGTVNRGANEVNQGTACMGVNVIITNARNGTNSVITARREQGGLNQGGNLVFYRNGARIGINSSLSSELDTAQYTSTLALGDRVQAGIIFNNGLPNQFACPAGSEVTVPYP
jgi:hypothetical protein